MCKSKSASDASSKVDLNASIKVKTQDYNDNNELVNQIIETKKTEIELNKKNNSFSDLERLKGFSRPVNSLSQSLQNCKFGIISEFKRKSPSKSIINKNSNVSDVVKGYENAGASGISILTDEQYFGGSSKDLILARENTNLPILRKEFIIDEYQILEAKGFPPNVLPC